MKEIKLIEVVKEEIEKQEKEEKKGKWMGICYESELDAEIGKHYA